MTAVPLDLPAPPATPTRVGIGLAAPNGGGCVDPLAFASLVERAVAAAATAQGQVPPAAELPGEPDGDAEPGTEETAAPVPVEVSLLALLTALPGTTIVPAAPAGAGSQDTESTASTATPLGTNAPADGSTSGAGASTSGTSLPAGEPTTAASAARATGPAPSSTPTPALALAPAPGVRPEGVAAASSGATGPAAQHQALDARPVDPGTVPVLASGPVTVSGGPGVADPVAAGPVRSVAAQVIPEITRLVSDGEGVHRVTLQLNPRALGEVRVVLTIRNGDVHVRIAGGEEARQAVAASSAELTRALHQVGIDEHRLTLTDLPATASSGRGPGTDHPAHQDQSRHHHTTGGHDPDPHGQNSHSRMGDARSATDGSSTSNPTGRSSGSAVVQEADSTRSTGGVDLRM